LLLASLAAVANVAAAKKFAGDFMSVGGGARALGMGGAFVSLSNDVTALYWNVAGIASERELDRVVHHDGRDVCREIYNRHPC